MNIEALKEVFELLKIANAKNHVLIPEIVREAKISKIELTKFIIENPKLIHTDTIWSYKSKKVKKQLFPGSKPYYDETLVKNRNLGLGIREVYTEAKQNWRTDEWLEHMIESNKKYIHLTEADNYGYIMGYYIDPDVEKDPEKEKYRAWKWRNTREKVNWLKENGFLHEETFVYGGFGDSYGSKQPYAISQLSMEELKAQGWTFNKVKPLSR